MHRFRTLLFHSRATTESGPNSLYATANTPENSDQLFIPAKSFRLTYFLMALIALGSCMAMTGCGGLVVNGSASSAVPALSSLACSNATVSGAGTDSCTITLTKAAPGTGFLVALSSSSAVVTVPASVTVASGTTGIGFTANITTVSSAQSVTLTSSAQGVNESYALTLSPQVAGGTGNPTLSVNASSVAFGNVAVGVPSTQSVTLSSTGTAAVIVNGVSTSGTGFTDSGITFPLTLNNGQPTATGAAAGQLTINSNSSTNSKAVIALSGTGIPLEVALSWDAPSGSTISGYNIYRTTGSSPSYAKLNSTVSTPATYSDTSVQASTTYEYYVTSVNSSGLESAPSNTATVNVP
jgi:hypothetical protein